MAFATRTWASSWRSQSPYTVAGETPSFAATCFTVRNCQIRPRSRLESGTKLAPKFLVTRC
jgi:hypothetical protein